MTSSVEADFVVGEDGDVLGFPTHAYVEFPPKYPTDIASKSYVDASFPGGLTGGSVYVGMLNFSTIGTPLYEAADVDKILLLVNRVGNMATITIGSCGVGECLYGGDTLIASGLPKEYWPISIVDKLIYISTVTTASGDIKEMAGVSIGINGLITIKLTSAIVPLGAFNMTTSCFSYLTS